MTDHERALAKKAAAKLLPAKLEDFKPVKRLPVGVYDKGGGYLASLKLPGGGWKQKYFQTEEQAVKAREDSLKQP